MSEERNVIQVNLSKNPKASPIETLFHMQHFGTATRICDLTISHLSALFFASEGDDTDGAVFVIRKDSFTNAKSYEMDLFSQVLTNDILILSEIEANADISLDIRKVLSQNYVIEYKYLGYSNPRAFRQGGTGIIFGFGIDGDSVLSLDNHNVDDFIIEKIIIPQTAKIDIIIELRKLGYSKEMLYDSFEEAYVFEDITLSQISFTVEQRFDKGWFNKIVALYRLNTLYYNRDELAVQIDALYKNFFAQYGENARIWTYFYFDDNDVAGAN